MIELLKQISLQQQGATAVLNDETVSKELKLTDEQKQRIKDLTAETMKEMRTAIPQGGDREVARQKIVDFVKKLDDKVVDSLTAEQKAKWKEMIGTPIKGDLRGSPSAPPRGRDGK